VETTGGLPHIVYIFRKLLSRVTFASQTLCLYVAPLKIIKLKVDDAGKYAINATHSSL